MRATCPSFPTAAETHIPSGTMDDLDLVDSAFVVTALSRETIAGTAWQASPGPRRCDHGLVTQARGVARGREAEVATVLAAEL